MSRVSGCSSPLKRAYPPSFESRRATREPKRKKRCLTRSPPPRLRAWPSPARARACPCASVWPSRGCPPRRREARATRAPGAPPPGGERNARARAVPSNPARRAFRNADATRGRKTRQAHVLGTGGGDLSGAPLRGGTGAGADLAATRGAYRVQTRRVAKAAPDRVNPLRSPGGTAFGTFRTVPPKVLGAAHPKPKVPERTHRSSPSAPEARAAGAAARRAGPSAPRLALPLPRKPPPPQGRRERQERTPPPRGLEARAPRREGQGPRRASLFFAPR